MKLQTSFFFHFLNRHHTTTANAPTITLSQPTTQRRQHNQTQTQHKHHQTQHKHHQTQHQVPAQMQAHFIQSGTRLAQLNQDSCFLHFANMFGQQGMDGSPRTLTLWQVRAVCTQREPTGRVIIVIVAERKERRQEREERKREENDGREKRRRKRTTEERERERRRKREREKEREGWRERREPPLPSSPCVGSKRLRVGSKRPRV